MYCLRPFYMMIVEPGGECRSCCEAHASKSFGNILRDGPEGVWRGEGAREMRESILDGSYRFCLDGCPIYQRVLALRESGGDPRTGTMDLGACVSREPMGRDLEWPAHLHVGHDTRCNIRCRKCHHWTIEVDEAETDRVGDLCLGMLPHASGLAMSGCGELFFSPSYAKVLRGVEAMPNLFKMHAITNGTLLTPGRWGSLGDVASKIARGSLRVSVDAATRETYDKVRRGGDFDVLAANLRFLGSRPISQKLMSMVVEMDNFREMPAFVRLAAEWGFRAVFEQVIGPDGWKPWIDDAPEREEFEALLAESLAMANLLWTNFQGAGR